MLWKYCKLVNIQVWKLIKIFLSAVSGNVVVLAAAAVNLGVVCQHESETLLFLGPLGKLRTIMRYHKSVFSKPRYVSSSPFEKWVKNMGFFLNIMKAMLVRDFKFSFVINSLQWTKIRSCIKVASFRHCN